ncbi:hypothetical protein MRX96_016258 [Rhipicephalus microplus]
MARACLGNFRVIYVIPRIISGAVLHWAQRRRRKPRPRSWPGTPSWRERSVFFLVFLVSATSCTKRRRGQSRKCDGVAPDGWNSARRYRLPAGLPFSGVEPALRGSLGERPWTSLRLRIRRRPAAGRTSSKQSGQLSTATGIRAKKDDARRITNNPGTRSVRMYSYSAAFLSLLRDTGIGLSLNNVVLVLQARTCPTIGTPRAHILEGCCDVLQCPVVAMPKAKSCATGRG